MAERILRSPGVTTRELDLSAPGRVRPQGIPAGIIGTSEKGPAFVPVTFATLNDFSNLFGETKGKHFGAMAVNEWMRNARSGLYLRVLGIGDGNTSSTTYTNQVAYSGFKVGQDMRDKDRTAASKALSTNGYATSETDGSGDNPVRNPYAGVNVPDKLQVASVGTPQIVAKEEKTAITPVWTTLAALDGEYFIIETVAAGGAKTKYLFWLSAQATDRANTPGARTISGQKIIDGGIETDLSSTGVSAGNIHFVDLTDIDGGDTSASSAATVSAGIRHWVNLARQAGGEAYSNIPDTDLAAVNAPVGDVVLLVNGQTKKVDATAAYTKANGTSTQLGVSNSADGGQASVDAVAYVRHESTIQFHKTLVPPAGTTIAISDGEGSAETFTLTATSNADYNANYEVDVETLNTSEKLAGWLFSYLTGANSGTVAGNQALLAAGEAGIGEAAIGTVVATSMDAAGGTPALLTSQHMTVQAYPSTATAGPRLVIRQSTGAPGSDATDTAEPTVTVTEVNASAPEGRVFFLGCETYGYGTVKHPSDYLGEYDSTGETMPLLRGVLMFPSGVMPGIVGTGDLTTSDIPSAAYGSYAVGQNLGEADGKGYIAADTGEFRIVLNGFSNTDNYTANKVLSGSFDTTSPIYFSKVFNTDPTKIQERGHYLHAHYDVPNQLAQWKNGNDNAYLKAGNYFNGFASSVHVASGDYRPTFEDWQQRFQHAFSPWIMSQKLGNAAKKLFRFHMLDAGSAGHGKIKVSIANIAKSTDLSSDYGTFDVQIRNANDTDLKPEILQSFSGLSLNPASDRYIGRVIGDQNTFYDFDKPEGKQKLVTEGLYPNKSQYVRVEVMPQIEAGQMEASALPLGFNGKHHLVIDGKALAPEQGGSTHLTGFKEPPLPFRTTVSVGKEATKVVDARFYWGAQWQTISDTTVRNQETGVLSLIDNLTKWYPQIGSYPAWVGDNKGTVDVSSSVLDADLYNNNAFSLENIWIKCQGTSTDNAIDATMWHEAVYIRDRNADGEVFSGSGTHHKDVSNADKDAAAYYRYLDVAKDFGSTASKKFFKFTVPMQGGYDGLDIFDQDKAEMNTLSAFREMDTGSSTLLGGPSGSSTAAFRKGLDILAEKSDVDVQLLATPGMRTAGITDYAIDKTEERFDALYIMDMAAYDHSQELVTTSAQETSVNYTAQKLADRNLDTSFAATYFPDLVIKDGANNVVAPPSVAVLGALSLNDKVAHPWYAPAGFARGALATTIETAVKLNRTNMDTLYETDINPITSFPQTGESVIVFGQKTMLQSQSALDRVNVRRLLIDVRRKVRTVANQILFEPNREATLARFSSLVNPILGRIQQQQGLDRYKVVIDTTTTTQQDVENNTIRGKIFLQPTRSIEFISLDFVVTNAGAEI